MRHLDRRPWVWRAVLPACGLLAGVIALGAASAPATTAPPAAPATVEAPPAVTPYPYEIVGRIGPWGFPTRYATDYIAWRLFERDVDFSSAMRGPNGRTGVFGEPKTWAANAAHIGFRVDTVPTVGSVAQWNAGEAGASAAGHVAYVERVNPDGSVVVSEFDWTVGHGYSLRGEDGSAPVRAPRYIHVG